MITHYKNLYDFTKLRVANARHLARTGSKDVARIECRWLRNSCVVEILQAVQWPDSYVVDVELLKWELGQLELECHPLDATPDPVPYGEIFSRLEIIAGWVQQQILRENSKK